jgi:hypothetical protein
LRRAGCLIAAIEDLRGADGKTLRPIRPEQPNEVERLLAETRLLNPERPGQAERRLTHLAKRLALAPGRALADAGRTLRDGALRRRPSSGV